MRTLLAIDGSEQSYDAVRTLACLNRSEAIILLHAMDVPAPACPTMVPEAAGALYHLQEKAMRGEGERVLKTAMSLMPFNAGPASKRLEVGKPVHTVLDAAERERIDLIVLGSRGRGLVQEVLLGSVSHQVITHAPCPVLVVRAAAREIRRALVAVERPEDLHLASQFLAKHPFKDPCQITVLTVIPFADPAWPVGAVIPDSLRRDMLAAAKQFTDEAASMLTAHGYSAAGVAEEGVPTFEIIRHASETKADIIVVGSRHGGLGRAIMGSVCHAVLHRAQIPVLVVR
jgi:nucleotide-binding universal stress UspA family protein